MMMKIKAFGGDKEARILSGELILRDGITTVPVPEGQKTIIPKGASALLKIILNGTEQFLHLEDRRREGFGIFYQPPHERPHHATRVYPGVVHRLPQNPGAPGHFTIEYFIDRIIHGDRPTRNSG